ncbi:MAG: tail-specific protease [Segetibacter sp.]|nr:tail-specific protease [Segetibacter sp.]
MLKRKVLPVLLIVLFAGIFWAFQSQGEDGKSLSTQQKILSTLGAIIEENHYNPKPINDQFSKELFKRYLVAIDPDKNIFLQSDVDALKKYETTLDDEIHGATLQFLPALNQLYAKRMLEVTSYYKEILAKPFTYTQNEELVADANKINFSLNEAERKDRWRKKLKFLSLERYNDLLEQREKNKGKLGTTAKADSKLEAEVKEKVSKVLEKELNAKSEKISTTASFKIKTDLELEAEARDKVGKIMDKSFERLKLKFTDDERFNLFVNTITSYMDPHSDYFPPVEKRSFDEQMSGRFYGIGASLREEEGNIKIATLLTGSPAWKSKQIQVGDIVLKVGQAKDEPVDLTGYAVEDAVKIIRGNKGTEVRLTLKKSDGSLQIVPLIRDEIVQDEVYVRSAVINGKEKIGYIYLPDFYADYEKPNGARCALDVAREVEKLKGEGVKGIIIDLRSNGGGYLSEVVQMVGLFIPEGPVVQVKDREGKPTVLTTNTKSVLWDGPLAVMINEFSASASEIFAAAIQDYGRGVIIGSSSTYGKGTVQRNIPVGKPLDFFTGRTEYGAVKLTLQKFYRVNGGSTQLKGVTPDIVLPDEYEYLKLREKDNDNALPWDEIQKSSYKKWAGNLNIAAIKAASSARVTNSTNFKTINNNAQWLAKQNDKIYHLNLEKYREEQKAIKATVKQNDELAKLTQELPVEALKVDDAKYNNVDKEKGDRYKAWLKNLRTDIYIDETSKVINDMIGSPTGLAKKN